MRISVICDLPEGLISALVMVCLVGSSEICNSFWKLSGPRELHFLLHLPALIIVGSCLPIHTIYRLPSSSTSFLSLSVAPGPVPQIICSGGCRGPTNVVA